MAESNAASKPLAAGQIPLELSVDPNSGMHTITRSHSTRSDPPSQSTDRQHFNTLPDPSEANAAEDRYFVIGDSSSASTSVYDGDGSGSESSSRVHKQRLATSKDLLPCDRLKTAEAVGSGRFAVVDHEAGNIILHSCEGSLVDESGSEGIEGLTDDCSEIQPRAVSGETFVEPSKLLNAGQDRSVSVENALANQSTNSVNQSGLRGTFTVLEGSHSATQLQEEGTGGTDRNAAGIHVVQNQNEASSPPRRSKRDPVPSQANLVYQPPKVERESYDLDHHNPLRDSIYSLQSEASRYSFDPANSGSKIISLSSMRSKTPPKRLSERGFIDLSTTRSSLIPRSVRQPDTGNLDSVLADAIGLNAPKQLESIHGRRSSSGEPQRQSQTLSIAAKSKDELTAKTISQADEAFGKPVLPESLDSSSTPSQPAESEQIRPDPPGIPPRANQRSSAQLVNINLHEQVSPRASSFQDGNSTRRSRRGNSSSFNDSTATTLIGTPSTKRSFDLKPIEWLVRNREHYLPSPVTTDTTVDFLRTQHDPPTTRNTTSQKAITAHAKREAQILENASKGRDLILSARAKLEADRRRRYINDKFSELDKSSRFSSRYPILVNRGIWLSTLLTEAGLISLALAVSAVITEAKHGDQVLLMGNPDLAWVVGSCIVLGCGVMLGCILLFKDGAFRWVKNRDVLGLQEVMTESPGVVGEKCRFRLPMVSDLESGRFYGGEAVETDRGEHDHVVHPRMARAIRPVERDIVRDSTLVRPHTVHCTSAPACLQVRDTETAKTHQQPQDHQPPVPRKTSLRLNTTNIPNRGVSNTSQPSRANSTARLISSPTSRCTITTTSPTSPTSPTPQSISFPSPVHPRFPLKDRDSQGFDRPSTKVSRGLRVEDMNIQLDELNHDGSPIKPGRGNKTVSMVLGN